MPSSPSKSTLGRIQLSSQTNLGQGTCQETKDGTAGLDHTPETQNSPWTKLNPTSSTPLTRLAGILSQPSPGSSHPSFSAHKVLVVQSCPTLYESVDCHAPGSSVHGILSARILELVSMPLSRGSAQTRGQTQISCTAGRFFTIWATREAHTIVQEASNVSRKWAQSLHPSSSQASWVASPFEPKGSLGGGLGPGNQSLLGVPMPGTSLPQYPLETCTS